MKTLPKAWTAIIYFLISIFIVLQSCKDAPIIPPIGEETELWKLDSICLAISEIGIGFSKDTALNISVTQPFKIRIVFTGETNFDSSKGFQSILLTVNSKDFYFTTSKFGYISINQSYIIEFNDILRIYNFVSFNLNIENSFDSSYKYIKLKNIKIYQIIYP